MPARALPLLVLLAGCDPDPDDTAPGDDTGPDADTDTDADADADTDTDADADTVPAHRITGQVTWTLDYDPVAEGEGYADCTYSRSYEGVEFLDQPYLCPECDFIATGTAIMTSGFADCYEPVFGGEADRVESWGFDWPESDGGTAVFYRGSLANLSLAELTDVLGATLDDALPLGWTAEYTLADFDLPGHGSLTLDATGEVTVVVDEATRLTDPATPRTDPYDCTWPLGNPGTLETDWILSEGEVLPTAWLEDDCDDVVDLWDFHGTYVVVEASQPDCGYCVTMTQAAPAFLGEMEGLGVEVRIVTLLGESLSNVIGEPTDTVLDQWLARYDDGEPVLKDRGYGYAVFGRYFGDDLGYPSYALVRPDTTVVAVYAGFSSWDPVKADILADLDR